MRWTEQDDKMWTCSSLPTLNGLHCLLFHSLIPHKVGGTAILKNLATEESDCERVRNEMGAPCSGRRERGI